MVYLLKMVIFNSYVSLSEGRQQMIKKKKAGSPLRLHCSDAEQFKVDRWLQLSPTSGDLC